MAVVRASHQVQLGRAGDVWASLTEIGAAMSWGAGVPAGVIAMWAGTLATLPTGWRLCDGVGGAPDLRDKFIKGWAAGVDPGATGGAATHTPTGSVTAPVFTGTLASLTHAGTAVADHASHTHSVTSNVTETTVNRSTSGTGTTLGTGTLTNNAVTSAGPSATLSHSVTQPNAHSYTPAGTNNAPAFTGNSVNHEPAYYKLAYIQKT